MVFIIWMYLHIVSCHFFIYTSFYFCTMHNLAVECLCFLQNVKITPLNSMEDLLVVTESKNQSSFLSDVKMTERRHKMWNYKNHIHPHPNYKQKEVAVNWNENEKYEILYFFPRGPFKDVCFQWALSLSCRILFFCTAVKCSRKMYHVSLFFVPEKKGMTSLR